MRANALFSKLHDECAEYVDSSFSEMFGQTKMSKSDKIKFQELGAKINKIETDLIFLENQIASSLLFEKIYETEEVELQRFNLN